MKIERTEPVDTTPIVISEFTGPAGQLLTVSPPLEIVPSWIRESGELLAEYEPLGIAVAAESREELAMEIREYLQQLWLAFVVDPAEQMTADAVQLRGRLLELVHE